MSAATKAAEPKKDGKEQSKIDEDDDKDEAKEPVMDRVMKEVVAPPMHPLGKKRLFDKKGMPNLAVLKEHLLKEGRLTIDAASQLINDCMKLLRAEPNMLELRYPITVCGDLHGQFFDLVRLFEVGGDPKDTQYLFLGDYVDRGCFSTEVVFYLYALKITYPKSLFLLRGNHECRQLTSFFNFKDECTYKYNLTLYDLIMNSFDTLPLAALINKAFFCVHGGLSPDITTLEEVRALDRFQEIPREGPMCDLLWSDPYEDDPAGGNPLPENPDARDGAPQQQGTAWFGYNDTRQCSYVYGIEAVKQFLKDNKLTSVIRAHEAQVDGYKMQMINKASGIPRVITIFSAPNYCDVYKNKAACLKFDNNVLNIKQFIDSPHPYYLPNFMDVFQWSLPFVAEKVTDMLANVLDCEGAGDDDEDGPKTVVTERGGLLKKKVMAVSKLLRVYKMLREENENIVHLKGLTPNHRLPFGLLAMGSSAIQKAVLTGFDGAKEADLTNERRPGSSPPPPGAGKAVRVPRSAVPMAAEAKISAATTDEPTKIKTTVTVAEEQPKSRAKSPAGAPRPATTTTSTPAKTAAPKRA